MKFITKTNFNPQIPLLKIKEFVEKNIGWEEGSCDVFRLMMSNHTEFIYLDYPTDIDEFQAQQWLEIFSIQIEQFNKENSRHPTVVSDVKVNSGALNLALNVLRRAGKNEIADELEKTAERLDKTSCTHL